MRKRFAGILVLTLALLGWNTNSSAQTVPAPRGELRVVDPHQANWAWITWNVMEHLMEFDKDGNLIPRLATSWRWLDDRTLEVKLRRGVRFHNGEVFDAEIVKLNWQENTRLKQPHMPGEYLNFKPGSRVEILDRYTVHFVFAEPDGAAMAKIPLLHMGNRQFYQEVGWGEKHWWVISFAGPWGTGPYRLVEGFSTPEKRTERVILEANTAYWDKGRMPRLRRIVFDNTLDKKQALERIKTTEGRVDLVTELSPLETLAVAQSRFAKVVKRREGLDIIVGHLNMRKDGSVWRDIRVRRAVNLAVDRADVVRYAAKGNGLIIPALVPVSDFGYDPDLAPYPFDPAKARELLAEAGYPNGFLAILIAPNNLEPQATVVGKMLERVGLKVDLQILDPVAFNQKFYVGDRTESETWDIAVATHFDGVSFPATDLYRYVALGGQYDWVGETPELQRLYDEVMRTVDRDRQVALIRQMERLTHDRAYFLFLYNPIKLYAVNRAVEFVAHQNGYLKLDETAVMDRHWSVRRSGSRR